MAPKSRKKKAHDAALKPTFSKFSDEIFTKLCLNAAAESIPDQHEILSRRFIWHWYFDHDHQNNGKKKLRA
uniref:Uncharacterized protein n=1 Tax=Glossina morsitans morsitans TaxID=37546 RepID=A0A1B0GCL9_GLOMM